MRTIYIYIMFALLSLQCSESEFNDLAGPYVLKGVVVIGDTLNGVRNYYPAKNYKVFIKYTGGVTNGFLYSTIADAAGQYSFNGIDPARNYTIYSSSDTGVVDYYGDRFYTAGSFTDKQSDSLILFPSSLSQNGIHLIVTNEQGHAVPNVTAWVFSNPDLFTADTSAGRVFEIQANQYGVGNKLNIAAAKYYLRVKTRIGAKDLAGEDTVDVAETGLTNSHIILSNIPLPRNGIEADIKDSYGTPVADAKVYVYRSQYIFENDTEDFSNSLFVMTSNASGRASAYVIEPGNYFLRAVRVINNVILKNTATITVPVDRPAPVSITIF